MRLLKETPRRRRQSLIQVENVIPDFSPSEKAEAWMSLGIGELYYDPNKHGGKQKEHIPKLDTEWEDLESVDAMGCSAEMREIFQEEELEDRYPEEAPEVTEMRVVKSLHSTQSLRIFSA